MGYNIYMPITYYKVQKFCDTSLTYVDIQKSFPTPEKALDFTIVNTKKGEAVLYRVMKVEGKKRSIVITNKVIAER
jgi:predicted Fe-Mo cluster-binding NifX family protein